MRLVQSDSWLPDQRGSCRPSPATAAVRRSDIRTHAGTFDTGAALNEAPPQYPHQVNSGTRLPRRSDVDVSC